MLIAPAVNDGQSFPYLGNRSLCLVASIRPSSPSRLPGSSLSVIHIPSHALPRFVALPDVTGKHVFPLAMWLVDQGPLGGLEDAG